MTPRAGREATRILILSGLVLAGPSVEGAGLDVFGGYSYARVSGPYSRFEPSRTDVQGFEASIGLNLGSHVALVADTSVGFGRREGADLRRTYLLGGPRLSARTGRLVFFLQALGGAAWTRESVTVVDLTLAKSAAKAAVLAGGGFDVWITRRFAIRGQADFLLTREADGTRTRSPRLGAGLVFGRRR